MTSANNSGFNAFDDVQPDLVLDDVDKAQTMLDDQPSLFDTFDAVAGDSPASIPLTFDADADIGDAPAPDAEDAEARETDNGTEISLDADTPLYGGEDDAEEDDAEGWKSVDFHVDDGDADDVLQNNAGSGGGNTPPPENPGTSSDNNASEPEHSRSTSGAPSTALITLMSEHSEHSEHSESFSSTDFDDPDWISPIYPESLWVFPPDIGEPFCEEVMKSGAVKYTALNVAYFARLVILTANLHMHHSNWHAYSEQSGTWCCLGLAKLLNIIYRCVMRYGKARGIWEIVKLCSARFCADVMKFMMPFPEYEDIFDHAPKNVINAKNGTIVIGNDGSIVLHEHSPEFLCRDVINIDYDPTADYTDFVREVFRDVVIPEDQETFKWYAGQCALGRNFSQKILIISGEAGTGKSIIVKVIEKVVGRRNWEGLRTNMLDQRFELSRFDGKSLLVASDQCSDALMKKGAHMLKTLTGGDDNTTERKGENEHPMISGEFNVIIVSNADLPLSIDGDSGAWKRRVLPIPYRGEKPETVVSYFEDYLMHKYPEQILNWMVSGAADLFKNGKKIPQHPKMVQRIDELIQESDACLAFVKNCVVHTGNTEDVLFSSALYNAFTCSSYFVGSGSKQVIQTKLGKAMVDVYKAVKRKDLKDTDGKAKYGYVGYRLERNEPE